MLGIHLPNKAFYKQCDVAKIICRAWIQAGADVLPFEYMEIGEGSATDAAAFSIISTTIMVTPIKLPPF